VTIYRYKNSVIDEVNFEVSDGGSRRAYIHALPNTNDNTLAQISTTIAKRGWQTVPHTLNGKATLEIRGFGRDQQVNNVLFENDWVHGPADIEAEKKDSKKFTDVIKKRSLLLSGLSFLISDTFFTIYGQKGNSPLNTAAGLSYLAGGVASTVFARKDTPDLQIKEIAGKMAEHMRDKDINLPDDCSLKSITEDKHKGLIKTSDDFFRRYPSETMNTLFGIAGACISTAALKNRVFLKEIPGKAIADMMEKKGAGFTFDMAKKEVVKNMKSEGWWDAGLGAMTMSSAAFGNLVEEKAHDPDTPRKHGLPGIWEWIQERPLAVTGVGYLVSTGCHTVSTAKAWKNGDSEARKAVRWRGLFIAWSIVGEILLAFSSKGHGKGVVSDKSVDTSVISLAADLISKQPPAKHNDLIDYMSGFLGREDVLAMKDSNVKDLLTHQVELMKNNPWAKCVAAASLDTDKSKKLTPHKTSEGIISNGKNWQVATKASQQESQSTSFI